MSLRDDLRKNYTDEQIEAGMLQNVVSSSAIENIHITPERLKQLKEEMS